MGAPSSTPVFVIIQQNTFTCAKPPSYWLKLAGLREAQCHQDRQRIGGGREVKGGGRAGHGRVPDLAIRPNAKPVRRLCFPDLNIAVSSALCLLFSRNKAKDDIGKAGTSPIVRMQMCLQSPWRWPCPRWSWTGSEGCGIGPACWPLGGQ